jgi:hypothetical protein
MFTSCDESCREKGPETVPLVLRMGRRTGFRLA